VVGAVRKAEYRSWTPASIYKETDNLQGGEPLGLLNAVEERICHLHKPKELTRESEDIGLFETAFNANTAPNA